MIFLGTWSSGLSRLPVTEKIAGSNPVVPASATKDPDWDLFVARSMSRRRDSNGLKRANPDIFSGCSERSPTLRRGNPGQRSPDVQSGRGESPVAPARVSMDLVQQSKNFTQKAFEEVGKYYSHSFRVGEILEKEFLVTDPEIIAAGILHDVLEDTNVSPEELSQHFPVRVASLVQEISHDKNPEYDREAYRNHLLIISEDAKLVKLADFLDSLRWMVKVYQSGKAHEYPKFQHNDDYIRFIRRFLETYPNSTPRGKVKGIVNVLDGLI